MSAAVAAQLYVAGYQKGDLTDLRNRNDTKGSTMHHSAIAKHDKYGKTLL